MTRRQLGVGIAAASLATKMTGKNVNEQEALQGVNTDPVLWTRQQYASAPLQLTFRANDRTQAEAWQKQLRAKLVELIGAFPVPTPLKPRSIETRKLNGFVREMFVFESRPGVGVVAYLLTPVTNRRPFPVIICVPGHGRGVDDIVGIDEQGNERTDKPGYQHDFAIQVVEHGVAALAIEPMGFGHRRDPITEEKGPLATACQPAAGSALLFGATMIGWRVWDVMRAIDWIETRPDLDASRVGCMGISGGGTCTLFSSALDTRIRAAFVSGYLNTFRDSIMSVSHCMDNYVPGILNWAENYDVAALIAPRPFFSEGGTRDPIFPIAATRESFSRVKKVYEVFGVPGAAQQEIFEGEHEFHGVQGLPFLVKSLA